ncbi:MAG: DsbA family protein [Beijerinckiaceae bacterium]
MKIRSFAVGFVLAGIALTPSFAQQAPAGGFSDAQKAAINAMIRDYLLKNPEVIQEAMTELDRRQKEAEREARAKLVTDKTSPLFTAKHNVPFGNPKGDVTIVEFFDYNCGFCRRSLADLQKFVAEDKNIRIITKDFPVLGPESVEAATVAMAARLQLSPEKMLAFHTKLLSNRGKVGKQQGLDAAKEAGADMARLQKDMEGAEVGQAIEQNVQLADALGLSGTPSYIVGDDVVVGAVGFTELKSRVDNVRKCGKAAC